MERSIDDLTFSFSSVASAVAFSIVGDWNKSFTSDWKLSISSTIFSFMISNTQLKICMPNSFCSEIWGLLHLTEWKQYNDRWVLEVYCNIVFFFLYFCISAFHKIHIYMTINTDLNQATLGAFDATHFSWQHPKWHYQMIMKPLVSTSKL